MTNAERIIEAVLSLDPEMNDDCIRLARIAQTALHALDYVADQITIRPLYVATTVHDAIEEIERIASE